MCQGDFDSNATTIEELKAEEHQDCRFFPNNCPVVTKRGIGPYCIPSAAHDIARHVITDRTTLDFELKDFRRLAPFPPDGFFDPTRQEMENAITDKDQIMERMGDWAAHILGIQRTDGASVNIEFKLPPSWADAKEYSVLGQSIYDEDAGIWTHECGSLLAAADVIRQVRYKAMPLAGPGEVRREIVPYCPTCNDVPKPMGADIYVEDLDKHEADILKRMRDSR